MTAQPKNLLEWHMNQASAARTVQKITDEARAKIERAVDAEPKLREVKVKDAAGRVITSWEGSPSAWLNQFAAAPKRLIAINTK
jgi:hypothetical protein